MRYLTRFTGTLLGVGMLSLCARPAVAQTEAVFDVSTDAIGSIRMMTDANQQIVERHDFLPFGEEWNASSAISAVKFAGKERDAESGLDYLGARYYQSQSGRFMSPDIPGIDQDLFNPQSWSLYAYVRNNPLRFVDPSGRMCENGYDAEKGIFCSGVTRDDPDRRAEEAWEDAQRFAARSEEWFLEQLETGQQPAQTGATAKKSIGDNGRFRAASACFAKNYAFAWRSTNSFFFKGSGRFARTAIGMLTGGAMARATGLTTLRMAAGDLLQWQGVANLSVSATLESIAANSLLNGIAVAAALETGITIGAGLDASYQTFIAGNCR